MRAFTCTMYFYLDNIFYSSSYVCVCKCPKHLEIPKMTLVFFWRCLRDRSFFFISEKKRTALTFYYRHWRHIANIFCNEEFTSKCLIEKVRGIIIETRWCTMYFCFIPLWESFLFFFWCKDVNQSKWNETKMKKKFNSDYLWSTTPTTTFNSQ